MKKRSIHTRPAYSCHQRSKKAAAFTPITLASCGIDASQLEPLQLEDSLLQAVLDVEQETLALQFLSEMTEIHNKQAHKKLLDEHTRLLAGAQKRLQLAI